MRIETWVIGDTTFDFIETGILSCIYFLEVLKVFNGDTFLEIVNVCFY